VTIPTPAEINAILLEHMTTREMMQASEDLAAIKNAIESSDFTLPPVSLAAGILLRHQNRGSKNAIALTACLLPSPVPLPSPNP